MGGAASAPSLSLERDPAARGVTVVLYYTVAGGVPSAEDVKAVDDMESLYKECEWNGKLSDKRRASWRSGSVAMRWLNKVVERTGEGGGGGGGGGVGEGGGGRTAGGEGEGGGGRNSATQSRGQRPYTRPLVSTVHNLSHHLPPPFAVPTLAHAPMPTAVRSPTGRLTTGS